MLFITVYSFPVYAQQNNYIVVLDPGHGGKDDGASSRYSPQKEKTINLQIAQYIKEELENYLGISVLMTRDCDSFVSLEERCEFAYRNQADLFISLHNNIDEYHHSSGSEIYISHKPQHKTPMNKLAKSVMNHFASIGLKDNGIKTRTKDGEKIRENIPESDITSATTDYYAVIRRCTNYQIDSMIIEHCYLDSWNDYIKHYSNDAQIREMAHCDAMGIVEYYGLTKKIDFPMIDFDISIIKKIFHM